jgi:hypothetical protein
MNKRIKQLAEQADMVRLLNEHAHEYGNGTFENTPYPELEKFAELIVQECLKKVEEEYKPVLEDKEMMKDTHWDGYVQCGVDSYVSIREHFFGVEE